MLRTICRQQNLLVQKQAPAFVCSRFCQQQVPKGDGGNQQNQVKEKLAVKYSRENVKRNVQGYVFSRFFDYVKNYDKVLEKKFPSAMHVYRVFLVGVKEFFNDMKKTSQDYKDCLHSRQRPALFDAQGDRAILPNAPGHEEGGTGAVDIGTTFCQLCGVSACLHVPSNISNVPLLVDPAKGRLCPAGSETKTAIQPASVPLHAGKTGRDAEVERSAV